MFSGRQIGFMVWMKDIETEKDDGELIFGMSDKHAAEQWGELYDINSATYDIIAQRAEPLIRVRNTETNLITEWIVSGEALPHYYAVRVEAEK